MMSKLALAATVVALVVVSPALAQREGGGVFGLSDKYLHEINRRHIHSYWSYSFLTTILEPYTDEDS